MALYNSAKSLAIILVISAILSQHVDARRNILKGRKALTRTYFRDSAIPAWAVVLLVGIGEIAAGVVVYFILKKIVLDPPITGKYSVVPVEQSDHMI